MDFSWAIRNVSNSVFILKLFKITESLFLNRSVPVYFVWVKYLSWIYYSNEVDFHFIYFKSKCWLLILTIYFTVKNVLVNQWDNIANISCSLKDERCLPNGTAVMDSLFVYPVRNGKNWFSTERLENILKAFIFLFVIRRMLIEIMVWWVLW